MSFLKTIFICLIFCAPAVAAANIDPELRPVFSSVMSDLPIMPGLIEDADAALLFDKPDGRIIETRATGHVPAHIIKNFYDRALPALGWQPIEPDTYVRNGEKLSYVITQQNAQSVLNLSVTPREEK